MKKFIPKLMKFILKWMKFILIVVKNCLRQALLQRFLSNPALYMFLMLLHSIKRIHLYHLSRNAQSSLKVIFCNTPCQSKLFDLLIWMKSLNTWFDQFHQTSLYNFMNLAMPFHVLKYLEGFYLVFHYPLSNKICMWSTLDSLLKLILFICASDGHSNQDRFLVI